MAPALILAQDEIDCSSSSVRPPGFSPDHLAAHAQLDGAVATVWPGGRPDERVKLAGRALTHPLPRQTVARVEGFDISVQGLSKGHRPCLPHSSAVKQAPRGDFLDDRLH